MEFVDFFIFFFFFPHFAEAPTKETVATQLPKYQSTKEMEVEVEENGASAGRGEVFQGGEGDAEMEVEDGEDGASAGRVEGGTDAGRDSGPPRWLEFG